MEHIKCGKRQEYKIKRPADLSIVKRLGRFYWVLRYNIICTSANERYEKHENNAKIAPLKEHFHTVYLKNTNISYGANLTSSKLLAFIVKAKLVYAFTHLPAIFPAFEQLYSASAFVEIVPKRRG